MLDLVGNPDCWFSHAATHIASGVVQKADNEIHVLYKMSLLWYVRYQCPTELCTRHVST